MGKTKKTAKKPAEEVVVPEAGSRARRFFKHLGRAVYLILMRWGLLALAAVALTWYLQYRVSANDADAAWGFWDEKPAVFWYSTLIMFCLVMVFYAIFHKPFRTIGVAFALITIVGYIHNTKMSFRGTPLLPEDFQLADQTGTLTKFIDIWELVRVILAAVLSVCLGFLLDRLTKYRFSFDRTGWKRWSRIVISTVPRVVILTAAIAGFLVSTDFARNHSGVAEEQIKWLDTRFVSWYQTQNYEENGFIIGFLYNLEKFELTEPDGYSESKIAELKKTYSTVEEKITKTVETQTDEAKPAETSSDSNKTSTDETGDSKIATTSTALSDANYNIVIILNESFYDPSLLHTLYRYTGADATPVLHEIQKSYPSGYMYSPDYGGGTATIEFEVFTGLSNYWAQTVPYTDIIPKLNQISSIATEAKAAGYQTTAIHSFTGDMYKRSISLKKEGFDRFITQDEMQHQEHDANSGYVNDRSIYQETLDVLKSSDQKQLIGTITMQNHAPYNIDTYDEYDFELSDLDFDPFGRDIVLAYLQSVHNSDKYLGEFLNELSKMGEKTVVLFFGDHSPGVFPMVNGSDNKDIFNLSHLTPYFIWSNFQATGDYADEKYGADFLKTFGNAFEPEEELVYNKETYTYEYVRVDEISQLAENITLPTTTPNCLTNALYGVLGLKRNAEKTLLAKVCEQEPILTPVYLGEKTPTGAALKDYELLNYDILGGEQYWYK